MNYPIKDTMLSFIQRNENEKPIKIDLNALSREGILIQDAMSTYLGEKAIGSTALSKASISPKAFKREYDRVLPKKAVKKDYLDFGTIAHSALLEADKFKSVVLPERDLRKKKDVMDLIRFYNRLKSRKRTYTALKDWTLQELREELSDLQKTCKHTIVTHEQREALNEIKANFDTYAGGIIKKIMKGALTEVSGYAIDPFYALPVKVRPDFVNIEENIGINIIGSLKTTSTETIEEFIHQANALKYPIKEGFYQRIMSHITGRLFATVMIVAQTVEPYGVYVHWWDEESIQLGMYQAEYYMNDLNNCFQNNHFPSFECAAEPEDYGIIDFVLPKSAFREERPRQIESII